MKIEERLFEIIRGELWGTPLSFSQLSHEEFEELMRMAEEQTVAGLVCDCLIKNNIKLERKDVLKSCFKIQTTEKRNALVNENIKSFVAFMERHGVDYIIVKGQVVGALYPNPHVRSSGDIDLYFVGDNYEKIKGLVESRIGKQLNKLNDGKHVEFEVETVVYELHNQLSQLATRKHQAFWNQMIDRAIQEGTDTVNIDGKEVKTLSATYNALYVFVHLFFHMTASGVGLRQLCDWAMVLKNNERRKMKDDDDDYDNDNDDDNDDDKKFEEILKKLGYFKAYKAMGAFLVAYLGLPEEIFPFTLENKDWKWAKVIKKNVLKSGNFGRSRRTVQRTGLLHSIDSGWLVLTQIFTFYRLAPQEVLLRFNSLGEWFLERFKIKKNL